MSIQDDLESMISALKQSTYYGPSSMFIPEGVYVGESFLPWCTVDLTRIDMEELDSEIDRIFEILPRDCHNVRVIS